MKKKIESQIQLLPLKEITPYDKNPRKNDEAVEAVKNSIKEFGFQAPIIVDSKHVIIVGHTRYKAAQELKLDKVPVIVAENLTDKQAKAYRIADNSTGQLAEWDFELLESELEVLKNYKFEDFGLDFFNTTSEEEFKTNPEERMAARENSSLRPFILVYEFETYQKVQKKLEEIKVDQCLKDYSEVLLHLLNMKK